MSVLGTAFTQPQPTIEEPGPAWATDVNAVLTELISRCSTLIDSSSMTLTTGGMIHGTRTWQIGAAAGQSGGGTWTKATGGTAGYWQGVAAADTVEVALQFLRFQRVKAVRIAGRSVGTAWTGRAWIVDITAGTRVQLGTTVTSAALTTIEVLTIPTLAATQLAANQHLVIEWTAGAALTRFLGCEVDFDRIVAT